MSLLVIDFYSSRHFDIIDRQICLTVNVSLDNFSGLTLICSARSAELVSFTFFSGLSSSAKL